MPLAWIRRLHVASALEHGHTTGNEDSTGVPALLEGTSHVVHTFVTGPLTTVGTALAQPWGPCAVIRPNVGALMPEIHT